VDVVTGGHLGRTIALALSYALLLWVGIDQLLHPSPVVSAATGSYHMLWASMLLTGGVLGFGGVVTDLWIVELVAWPLCATPFLVWGWVLFTLPERRWGSVAVLLLIVVYQTVRGVDIWWLATRAPRRGR
jgi:hypothetical protein